MVTVLLQWSSALFFISTKYTDQFMDYLLNLLLALTFRRIAVVITNIKLISIYLARKFMMDPSKSSRFIISYPSGGDGRKDLMKTEYNSR